MSDAKKVYTLSENSKIKYDGAIRRIKDAGKDLADIPSVIEWIKTKGGDSAQKVYYSAIKYHLGKENFPQAYQNEIDRLAGTQKVKAEKQELSTKQVSNFVSYEDLLAVQKRLAAKEDKSDKDWEDYIVASLYTLNPPVRADYGEVRIFKKRRSTRTGNELIWGQKGDAYFVFRNYKTKTAYGDVEVRVSPALSAVITEWFAHLGKTPKWLLGNRAVTPHDLLNYVEHAFKSTKKTVGINLLRHAYIQHHLPAIATDIEAKKKLSRSMLHSVEKQAEYYSKNV